MSLTTLQAYNAERHAEARAWRDRARAMRRAGCPLPEIAQALGLSKRHVRKAIGGVSFDPTGAKDAVQGICIPSWVRRADLVSDFRDTARLQGEFAAAALCRSLLRDMRAGL